MKSVLVTVTILLLGIIGFFAFRRYDNTQKEKQRLHERYERGLQPIDDKENFFNAESQYAYWDSLYKHTPDSAQRLVAQRFKSVILLRMGKEQQAIGLLNDLVQKTKSDSMGRVGADARNYLALAYLRLGERNNCISNHSMASCIFPIQGSGVYTDPSASEKSIRLYQQILKNAPNDLDSRWLLNIAYMTIGKYPAGVPPEWLIPALDQDTTSYKIKPFTDAAGALRLNGFRNLSGGSIVDDFDNDGYLDFITSSMGLDESMHFFKNNRDGTFSDASVASGLSKIRGGLNITQTDYNNDGNPDIFIMRGAWMQKFGKQPVSLLRNNGDGTFTDVTLESGLISFFPTQASTWADFNNDGWLDVYIGNETTSDNQPYPSELFINNRDGSFTNVTKESGAEVTAYIKGVTSADYNNDGWPDIFLSCLDGKKVLLKNKGIKGTVPQFEDVTHAAWLDFEQTFTFPTWFWDYDNDGWPDIFVCGYLFDGSLGKTAAAEALDKPLGNVSKMYLYHNNQDGTFTDVTGHVGLDRPVFAMGSNFGDIDNDGWPDMYLGTGNPDLKSLVPNRLFKNLQGKKFVDVTNSARVGNLQKGHGVSFADIDNDGDQDIFLETGGPFKGDAYYNSLYINPGQNNNNWIGLLLEGVESNRAAIGARIRVRFKEEGLERTVYKDVNSGGSFGSSPLRQEIGIGSATEIDDIDIFWPRTGQHQNFKNIQPRQFLKIKEGADRFEKMDLKLFRFSSLPDTMDMRAIDCAPVKVK